MAFEDTKVHVRLKLFALWSSVMFFYIYGGYFELYETGKLQEMIAGKMPFAAISQGVLLGMAVVMVVPSLMPFLSLVLPLRLNRWLNIVFGVVYSLIMLVAFKSAWHFYILFGVIEIVLTLLIVWYGPRARSGGALGFADPSTGVGYAYVTSQMGTKLTGDPRDVALRDALYSATPVCDAQPMVC
jgi:hypothetical protein